MNAWVVLAVLVGYIVLLFVVAQRNEVGHGPDRPWRRSLLYALSLAVYCTSWTYFAALADAAADGWTLIGFYVGPALAVTLFAPMWRRLAIATKRERAGSIADFLAGRYGRSHALGVLVTAVALIAALPQIAMQLNALALGWQLLATGSSGGLSTPVLVAVAVLLLVFAIMFGARHADLTAQNRGLLHAIGVQSVVKLAGLLVVAGLALWLLTDAPAPQAASAVQERLSRPPDLGNRLWSMTFLGFSAMFCFPKQFLVGFVDLREPGDIRMSRWVLPLYLALSAAVIWPIAVASAALTSAYHADPALAVLNVTLAHGSELLLALVVVGGFSAAASMVVVETIALSAMVSNQLLLPWITWRTHRHAPGEAHFTSVIVLVRRVTMAALIGAACLFVILNRPDALRTVGIASFVAAAQFFPLLVGAIYWQRASVWGAIAGLTGGMAVWAWAGYAFGVTGGLSAQYTTLDPLTFTLVASLSANTLLFIVFSLVIPVRMIDRVTARSFVHGLHAVPRDSPLTLRAKVDDLSRLVAHFLGEEGAREGFAQFGRETGQPVHSDDRVSPQLALAAERMLAGFIGSASARSVIAVALAGPYGARTDMLGFLDNAMGAVEFSRGVLQSTLDSLPQGVCVLDPEHRVIAWNGRFLAVLGIADGVMALQRPWPLVASAIAAVAASGSGAAMYGFGLHDDGDDRLQLLLATGRTVRITRARMTSEGTVLTVTDITEDRAQEAALRRGAIELERVNEGLEARVTERTQALEAAKEQAERADRAKSRFLAAASHDLLQPLHAARLFIAALQEDLRDSPERALIAVNADRAINSADRMLRALLNLSQLDTGAVRPAMRPIFINDLFVDLYREFGQMAERKNLRLRMVPSTSWLHSDPDLLRSVLQNLVINAIRYTNDGGVLIGCRSEGSGSVRLEVWDTGRGIAEASLKTIFGEFVRLDQRDDEPGMGLGLAIVDRVAHALGHGLFVRSTPGKGSLFAITAERARSPGNRPARVADVAATSLDQLRVLCVDDDEAVLASVAALLERWGAIVTRARSREACLQFAGQNWDAALLDYQIGGGSDGLSLLREFDSRIGRAAIVTAHAAEAIGSEVEALGAVLLHKPLDPDRLRRFLVDVYEDQLGGEAF